MDLITIVRFTKASTKMPMIREPALIGIPLGRLIGTRPPPNENLLLQTPHPGHLTTSMLRTGRCRLGVKNIWEESRLLPTALVIQLVWPTLVGECERRSESTLAIARGKVKAEEKRWVGLEDPPRSRASRIYLRLTPIPLPITCHS